MKKTRSRFVEKKNITLLHCELFLYQSTRPNKIQTLRPGFRDALIINKALHGEI